MLIDSRYTCKQINLWTPFQLPPEQLASIQFFLPVQKESLVKERDDSRGYSLLTNLFGEQEMETPLGCFLPRCGAKRA